jgi:hypothetical protein
MNIKKAVKSYIEKKSRNVPSNKELWDKIQDLVAGRKSFINYKGKRIEGPRGGKGFKIHPSAYSNGWSAKKYKELGGTWKKEAKSKRDRGSDHGGLDAWFDKKTPWGDWVAITPVKHTVTLENGDKKTYTPGDIVGPCGISNSKEWSKITENGTQPLKCMARPQAEKYTKKERAELAKNKMKKEKEQGKSTKVTLTPSFGDKAKEIIKKKKKAGLFKRKKEKSFDTLKDKINKYPELKDMLKDLNIKLEEVDILWGKDKDSISLDLEKAFLTKEDLKALVKNHKFKSLYQGDPNKIRLDFRY